MWQILYQHLVNWKVLGKFNMRIFHNDLTCWERKLWTHIICELMRIMNLILIDWAIGEKTFPFTFAVDTKWADWRTILDWLRVSCWSETSYKREDKFVMPLVFIGVRLLKIKKELTKDISWLRNILRTR